MTDNPSEQKCAGTHKKDPENPPRTAEETCLCKGHLATFRQALNDLPELYVSLYLILEPSAQQTERVSGTREAPAPLRVAVSSLMADIAGTLTDWEDLLSERAGWDHAQRRNIVWHPSQGISLTTAVEMLTRHQLPILASDVGPTVADEVIDYAGRARFLLACDDGDQQLPFDCPACGKPTLVRYNGDDSIRCTSCAAREPKERIPWVMRRFAAEKPDLVLPTRQVAELCGVAPSTIVKWSKNGKLTPAWADERRQPLYLAADVMRLAGVAA